MGSRSDGTGGKRSKKKQRYQVEQYKFTDCHILEGYLFYADCGAPMYYHEEKSQPIRDCFTGELRKECEEILLDIREKCFREEFFYFAQTNRIAGLIKEKYGIEPERNKAGYGTNGVFRNPVTRKWVGLVMYNRKSNLVGDSEEKVEYLNLNFKQDADLYQREGIYHPYKKQNKHWLVVIMDEQYISQGQYKKISGQTGRRGEDQRSSACCDAGTFSC